MIISTSLDYKLNIFVWKWDLLISRNNGPYNLASKLEINFIKELRKNTKNIKNKFKPYSRLTKIKSFIQQQVNFQQ